jgi:hypothetical protein
MPWKATCILWPALVAALLPLDLWTLIARWPNILARLDALDRQPDAFDISRARPRKVALFRSHFALQLAVQHA